MVLVGFAVGMLGGLPLIRDHALSQTGFLAA